MQSAGSEILKHAHELAYAGFRLGGNVPDHPAYGRKLEAYALELLDAAIRLNDGDMETWADNLIYLARFGADTDLISQHNVEILAREVLKFRESLAGFRKNASLPEFSIESIFRQKEVNPANIDNPAKKDPAINNPAKEDIPDTETIRQSGNNIQENPGSIYPTKPLEGLASGERERAIIERIGRNGSCRLKDIMEALPAASERTIRYNLQALVGRGVVERVGIGGPATFYRLRSGPPPA